MAGFGQLTSTMMMVLNILKIPPGTTLRKEYGGSGNGSSSLEDIVGSLDIVNTMVEMTANDVCVGNSPVFIQGKEDINSPILKRKCESIERELNKISRWAAIDLLKRGVSVYRLKMTDNGKDCVLIPVVENLSFFMTDEGKIIACGDKGEEFKDALIFFSYSKETMVSLTKDGRRGKDIPENAIMQIIPQPIQLKNIASVAKDLYTTERSIYNYRQQLSRIVRFATVDVSHSKIDKTQEVLDSVSEAINANSMSLPVAGSADQSYDDQIAVLAHNNGIGKPEMFIDVPDFDINNLADLDYTMGRLFTAMMFPKSYSDFSTNLPETAISTMRSDIRYHKMVNLCRSLMEDTMNAWFSASVKRDDLRIKMATVPTTEDDDLIQTMGEVMDYVEKAYVFVVSDSEDKYQALGKLESIKLMLGGSAGFKYVNEWYEQMKDLIDNKFDVEDAEAEEVVENNELPAPPEDEGYDNTNFIDEDAVGTEG